MKPAKIVFTTLLAVVAGLISCTTSTDKRAPAGVLLANGPTAQVPTWSRGDLDFFLHGSMSTEMIPERVLRAFIRAYPDLFPTTDLSHLGLIPDPAFGWPVGFSRRAVDHLGGQPSVGINCAACHVGEVASAPGAQPVRVLGVTSHFDAEAFFGSLIVASFRTADPANMKKYLAAYRAGGSDAVFEKAWAQQESRIAAAMKDDPFGAKGIAPGELHEIAAADLRLDYNLLDAGSDLVPLVRATLKLLHNTRAALHVPDQPPDKAPPASGPGRNDAFGLLSLVLFGTPQPYAPVKYGLVWNLEQRHWVHWDGNTQSPIGRNLLAALGLGAPLLGHDAKLNFADVKRQTDLGERIHAPRYPWAVDTAVARRGAVHFQAKCASCHDGGESDRRLFTPDEIGTDPTRATAFTPTQAEFFNKFLAGIKMPGYAPAGEPGIRSTQKLWSPTLAGVWARSPYLHNGSVRTLEQLLAPPAARARTFHRGSRIYDVTTMGFTDEGNYIFDTTTAGNANTGHDYGTDLSPGQKRELLEFLKTL